MRSVTGTLSLCKNIWCLVYSEIFRDSPDYVV
ncbi:similar to PIRB1 (predicted) [Rattus norvegicus]|uniref:Similar to PIRB1 (Predicted) n=1 Tax=Rattus norvegicus TaxID=10116 RepID=A6KNK1_RAT|nr:similar to PIRB1 (predicted) [Rattus norvegicus]